MESNYKTKSRDADFDQHANKIFTAIHEIDNRYAEKRAIWELFQNALDIVEDIGIIRISKTDKGLKFEHNGRPFNDGNLTGLIKQTSNGKTYGSNNEGVGQYGTGFLSTHVYGKRIFLNASVNTDRGDIKKLDDFLIDREGDSPDELNKKIQIQDEAAALICDGEGHVLAEHMEFTSFEYEAIDAEKLSIANMLDYVHSVLPIVFVFNDKLDRVEINTLPDTIVYRRGELKGTVLPVWKNNIPLHIQFIPSSDNQLKILLPQSGIEYDFIPKQFLFYPLAETVDIGVNFIVHARGFKPNKERDYLFLESSNPDLQRDVATNHDLLDKAFELITKKVTEDSTVDFLAIIDLSFAEQENEYWKEKKEALIQSIKELERISIGDKKVSLTSISYLHEDILERSGEDIVAVYKVLKQFYLIPEYDVYIELSKRINNWKNEGFTRLHFSDILSRINEEAIGNYSNITDKNSYQTLIKIIASDSALTASHALIPNIHNKLCKGSALKKWINREDELIGVMDRINADVSQNYLHEDFYFLENVIPYSREEFKDDLNKLNGELINLLEKDDSRSLKVNSVKFHELIETLVNFIALNRITETNKTLTNFFTRVYKLSPPNDSINSPSVVLNYDSSFKLLARLYIKDQETKTVQDSFPDLREFVGILYNYHELRKNLLDKLKCFPNQSFELKGQYELKVDEVRDKDFKDVYKEITGNEIRDVLLLNGFEKFIQHSNAEYGNQVGERIERKLNPNKKFVPIDPDILPTLITLIEHMSKPHSEWIDWLPNLNAVKEEIMMSKFKDEETRSSLFSILSGTKEKIQTLGKLAQINDLDALIKAGLEKQKEERRRKTHLEHITSIGLKIQDIIKAQLDESLAKTIEIVQSDSDEKLETVEEQNGQDFIIYKSGHPIYYIEVKSRWDSEGIVALSKRQVERCAQNPSSYAVITVNVADYKSRNNVVEENISFDELSQDIYVNTDLGDNFNQLVLMNRQFEVKKDFTRLIEFRGHIPMVRIKNASIKFNVFMEELKSIIMGKI